MPALRLAVAGCCATAGPTTLVIAEPALVAASRAAYRPAYPEIAAAPATGVSLATHLRRVLASLEPDGARLPMARGIVHDTTEKILDTKERSAYALAAELVAVLAATTAAVDGTPSATITAEFEARYRRFSAFRKELRAATGNGAGGSHHRHTAERRRAN